MLSGSPPLSINDIVGEYGGPGAMLSYYRGGSFVPNIPANSGVPTSGAISILDFLGTGLGNVVLVNHNVLRGAGSSTTAFSAAGVLSISGAVSITPAVGATEWNSLRPNADGSYFDVFATLNSGSATGTFGSWLSINTTRAWTTAASSQITYQIRKSSTGAVLNSGTITTS